VIPFAAKLVYATRRAMEYLTLVYVDAARRLARPLRLVRLFLLWHLYVLVSGE